MKYLHFQALFLSVFSTVTYGYDDSFGYDLHRAAVKVHERLSEITLVRENSTLANRLQKSLQQFSQPEEWLLQDYDLFDNTTISGDCKAGLEFIQDSNSSYWKLQLLDSWGKFPSGVLQGNFFLGGSYDQCLNISVDAPGKGFRDGRLTMRYCTATFINKKNSLTISYSMCLPRDCDATDAENAVTNALDASTYYISASCADLVDKRTLPGGRILAIVVIGLLIAVCLLGTLLELITQNFRQTESINSMKDNIAYRTITAFSFYSNSKKIMDTKSPPGAIRCINGIRFVSMTWVILGHTLAFYTYSKTQNAVFISEIYERFSFEAIMNTTVSVDSFFVLSGLLVAYLFLKDFHRRKMNLLSLLKATPMIYIQRYIRLTPAYAFLIIIWSCLLYYFGSGPQWPTIDQTFDKNCATNWYLNILYVNNIFKLDSQCALWGWYLANDFQFFLIAPFIVFLYYTNKAVGLVVASVTVLGSIIAAVVVSNEQHTMFTVDPEAKVDFTPVKADELLYDVPWTRYQTYGIGLIAGLLLWTFKTKNIKVNPILNLFMWGVSAALCISYLYGPYDANRGYHVVHLYEADLYNGLGRTAWAIGLSYVIIACHLGQGGWINEFLSWNAFIPLSRLTYCGYLIHIPIIYFNVAQFRNKVIINEVEIAKDVIYIVVAAMIAAFPFSLLFEVPFVSLDKLYLMKFSIKSQRHQTDKKPLPEPDVSQPSLVEESNNNGVMKVEHNGCQQFNEQENNKQLPESVDSSDGLKT